MTSQQLCFLQAGWKLTYVKESQTSMSCFIQYGKKFLQYDRAIEKQFLVTSRPLLK